MMRKCTLYCTLNGLPYSVLNYCYALNLTFQDEDPKNAWKYLLENDFVAILKQFPLSEMFKHVLLITGTGMTLFDIRFNTRICFNS